MLGDRPCSPSSTRCRRARRRRPAGRRCCRPATSPTCSSTRRTRCGSTGAPGWSGSPVRLPTRPPYAGWPSGWPRQAGRRLDDAAPWVDARLPGGVRLHAVLPPVVGRGHVRVAAGAAPARLRPGRARAAGSLPAAAVPCCVRWCGPRLAFLVTGGTGSRQDDVAVRPARSGRPAASGWCSSRTPASCSPTTRTSSGSRRAPPERRGRGRGDAARSGPPGAAHAAGPARRRRGARRRGGRPARRAQHRSRGWLRHGARELGRPTCRRGSRRWRSAAGLGREALHAQVHAGLDAVVHLVRDRGGQRRIDSVHVLERVGSWVEATPALWFRDGAVGTGPGLASLERRLAAAT